MIPSVPRKIIFLDIDDDDFDMPAFPERLVRTSKQYGLSPRDLPAVLAILAE